MNPGKKIANDRLASAPLLSLSETRTFALSLSLMAVGNIDESSDPSCSLRSYDWAAWIIAPLGDPSLFFEKLYFCLEELPPSFSLLAPDPVFPAFLETRNGPLFERDIESGGLLLDIPVASNRNIPKVWNDEWYRRLWSDAAPVIEKIDALVSLFFPDSVFCGIVDISGEYYWSNVLARETPRILARVEHNELQDIIPSRMEQERRRL